MINNDWSDTKKIKLFVPMAYNFHLEFGFLTSRMTEISSLSLVLVQFGLKYSQDSLKSFV